MDLVASRKMALKCVEQIAMAMVAGTLITETKPTVIPYGIR